MKIITTVILLTFYCLQLSAQTFLEIKGGYAYNKLFADKIAGGFERINPSGGYYFSGQLNFRISNLLAVKSGLELLQKNYLLSRTNNFAGVYQSHQNLYLTLPISFHIKLIDIYKFGCNLSSGAYGGYWLLRNIEGTIPNAFDTTFEIAENGEVVQNFYFTRYIIKNQFISLADNRYEIGYNFGIHFHYRLAEDLLPILGLNFYQSFTDIQREFIIKQNKQVNQTMVLSMGILLKLQ